eukprot:GFUD01012419.1.p1 GENE.GFUD01012419.1~~GFUD01012419.1.p1  ORF type:complete len:975 (-),score=207.58 GFUD01012419.1:44-2638(-)
MGRFNINKLECYADTINIVYGDNGKVVKEEYETDENNKLLKVKLKMFDKQCQVMKGKASLITMFGDVVLEKEFELTATKLEGEILLTNFEGNSRMYLNFSTRTVGLLDCYDEVKIEIDKPIVKPFLNPLDVTAIFPQGCKKKHAYVSLMSTVDVSILYGQYAYVNHPSLHPPSQENRFEVILNKNTQTIVLTTTPPAPLNCLTATVNGTSVPLDTSGRLDVRAFSSPCMNQVLYLQVDTDGEQDRRTVLTKMMTLPRIHMDSHPSLVYHEQSKTVQVEADGGILACVGDRLKITPVAGFVGDSNKQMCDLGIWISGSRILAAMTNSYIECRQKCQETNGCSFWRFHKSKSSCKMFSKMTRSDTRYNDYVSGSKLCVLKEDKGTWVIENSSRQFSLSPYLSQCREAILNIEYEGLSKDDLHNLTIEHIPHINITLNDTHIALEIENEDFEECEDLKYELQCLDPDSDIYTSFSNFTRTTFSSEEYRGLECRVRAWLEEDLLTEANFEYFNITMPASEYAHGGSGVWAVSVIPLLIIGMVFLYFIRKQKKRFPLLLQKSNEMNMIPKDMKYNTFKKNSLLQNSLEILLETESETLIEEFKNIGTIVQEKINPTVTFNIAMVNADRNRYTDMVPYDQNIATLTTKTGNPASDYVSASWIRFKNYPQKFIASQAPKPNTFAIFWQLVFEQKVHVIVMITDLVDGNKVKAHQYWPDMDSPTLQLEGGMKVEYLSHSYPGTYYHRKMRITSQSGLTHEVNQLQCTAWKDMAAPSETKILLDLAYAIPPLKHNLTPLLVHCSAGVGRTGTFIGFYKLIEDIMNDEVKEVSVFETVLEMRSQRKQMVQKDVQYIYLHKCLKDFLSAQESDYA